MAVIVSRNRWRSLAEAAWVKSIYEILQDLPAPLDEEIDVRNYTFPDRQPIEKLRELLTRLDVPDTSHIGDEFTRRVGENLFTYLRRNSWLAVDRTAQDLQFEYTFEWRHGDRNADVPDSRRTAIDFRITPSPQITPDERYVRAVADWLRWVWPYLDGEVDCVDGDPAEGVRPRIKVELASSVDLTINMHIGARAVVHVSR